MSGGASARPGSSGDRPPAAGPRRRLRGRGSHRRIAHRRRHEPERQGEREARIAKARELAAAAVANLEVDPELSVLLASKAVETTRSSDGTVLPEAEEALHRAVVASRLELEVPGVGGILAWSPSGVFVTEGPEDSGIIDIRDGETGDSVLSFQGHDGDVNDVAFSAGRLDARLHRR